MPPTASDTCPAAVLMAPDMDGGSADISAPENIDAMSGALDASVLPNETAISPTLGTTFRPAVMTDSTSWSVRAPMSASSFPSPVSQFCHEAFIIVMLPSMVLAASAAVVPVMPISVWTTWIALTMLSKLRLPSSTVSPSCFCTSVRRDASLMSLSISDWVPPYPSLKLSSIVKFCFANPWKAFCTSSISDPKTLTLSAIETIAVFARSAAWAVSPPSDEIRLAEKLVACSM